jgi:hypothetical protein
MWSNDYAMTLFARGKLDCFLLCLLLGAWATIAGSCTVIVVFLMLPISRAAAHWQIGYTLTSLPLSIPRGIFAGAVWSLFAVPMLRRKPLDRAVGTLVAVVATVAVLSTLTGVFQLLGNSIGPYLNRALPHVGILLTCTILWKKLPDLPAWACSHCGHQLGPAGVCQACGDATMYARRAAQYRVLGAAGLIVSAGIIILFFATLNGSCGSVSYHSCVGIGQGTLVVSEGWRSEGPFFWGNGYQFFPMTGLICWPIIAPQLIAIPLWIVVPALALPSWRLWQRGRRPPPGHCGGCGYDLMGNTSGVCPECGRLVNV